MNKILKIFLEAGYFLLFVFFTHCGLNEQSINDNTRGKDIILHPHVTIKSDVQREKPFKKDTYFLLNGISEGQEQALIDTLSKNGIKMKSLWVPFTYLDCMGAIPSQLFVCLDNPDDQIKIYGFTTDSTGIGYCVKSWKEYVFEY